MPRKTDLIYAFLDGSQLANLITRDAPRVNRGIYDRLHYLDPKELWREAHVICLTVSSRKVVGNLALQDAPDDPEVLWLKHVTVDPVYRKQGLAKEMLERVVLHCEERQKQLLLSSFSKDGERFLKPVIAQMMARHPNVIIERQPGQVLGL